MALGGKKHNRMLFDSSPLGREDGWAPGEHNPPAPNPSTDWLESLAARDIGHGNIPSFTPVTQWLQQLDEHTTAALDSHIPDFTPAAHLLPAQTEATAPSGTPSLTTDQSDYPPGGTVTFTMSGIEAGSTYTFQVQDAPSSPGDDADIDIYKPFAATDGGKGDLDGTANGEIVSTWRVPSNGDATGATLNASATSSDGSIIATTTFTDAKPGSGTTVPNVSVNLDQWADGSVLQGDVDGIGKTDEIWVNGNLNATKAHYNEGDAIPYRAKIDNLTHGVTYGVTIQWDTTQQNQYAIDYLTGYNFAFAGARHPGEQDVTPLHSAGLPSFNDLSSQVETPILIPGDPQLSVGFGGTTGGLPPQPSGAQSISLFGNVTNTSTNGIITYTMPDLSKASLTIYFTYNGNDADGEDAVVLAWGGHIASSVARGA